jgi:hypothetical protein
MTRIILVLLLAVASNSAMAEWIVEGENGDEVFSSDHASIHWNTDKVKMLFQLEEKKEQEISSGKKYMSVSGRNEFDCTANKSRVLYAYYYANKETKGDVVFRVDEPSEWAKLMPNSKEDVLWHVACESK